MSNIVKIVLFILGVVIHRSSEALHAGLTACKVDAKFDSCLNKAIEGGVAMVKNGVPDYNLPILDPFKLASLTVGAGSGPVNLVQNYKNIVIDGFGTKLTVNGSHVDFGKKVLTFSTLHPKMEQNADYDINGKILMLPVFGRGHSTLTLENCVTDHKIEFDEKKVGNDVFYIPKSYVLKLHPSHARYLFENLFDGNKLLGDNINNVINQEWRAIFDDVGKGYEVAYAKIFLQYTKKIFEKVPVKEIFLQ